MSPVKKECLIKHDVQRLILKVLARHSLFVASGANYRKGKPMINCLLAALENPPLFGDQYYMRTATLPHSHIHGSSTRYSRYLCKGTRGFSINPSPNCNASSGTLPGVTVTTRRQRTRYVVISSIKSSMDIHEGVKTYCSHHCAVNDGHFVVLTDELSHLICA